MSKKNKTQKKAKVPMKHKPKARKVVKKRFFAVEPQLTSTKINLYAATPEELEGKVVKLDLSKLLRGKSFELRLKVKKENGKLTTEVVSLELFQSYIRKTMRKGSDYIEDSFEVQSKDAVLIMKPFLITRRRVSREVLKSLRENTKKLLTAYIKIRSAKEIFSEITTNKLQKMLSSKLKKIYPLALCEIRSIRTITKVETKQKEAKKTRQEVKNARDIEKSADKENSEEQ